ncbi:MAG: hypothetical protein H6568_14395 [Lewinellaceae bacterium]|nr:hypothetical protein [Saprospiraceae bacterium]MCB9313945.1 hypothetical protein [Lewinellaceae bacterium]HRW75850.1 DUF6364 family protein [Saprospiraceae bacterium]
MDTKLTLRLDKAVIEEAKEYARAHQTSLSSLVEAYLALLTRSESTSQTISPLVRQLTGVIDLKQAELDQENYREHLAKKYQ